MDAMHRDEDRLLERFVAGDPDAFVALYRLHLPAILGWLLRRTGDPEVTADLAAETFCAALLAAPRYGTSERSFAVKSNFSGFEIAVGAERRPDAVIWTLRNGQRRTVG